MERIIAMIHLREIDESNWLDCIDLKHEDERFVGSPAFILADAYVSRHYMTAYAFYMGETIVGMTLLQNEPTNHEKGYAFTEFFIDDRHLRKGYGRQAVGFCLEKLRENGFAVAKVCVEEKNDICLAFCRSCGFTESRRTDWDSRYIDFSMIL